VNVRHEDKRRFDLLHAYWCSRRGGALSQWDAFSMLFGEFLAHADLPPHLVAMLA
jgi:hypothetical protein